MYFYSFDIRFIFEYLSNIRFISLSGLFISKSVFKNYNKYKYDKTIIIR
jgi:hypothetical protein